MGGFGSGPFGYHPFGEQPWGRTVRYGLLPITYRERDAQEGYPLYQYAEGVRALPDELRGQIRAFPDLRDALTARASSEGRSPLELGARVLAFGARTQYGVDGRVLARLEFVSDTARFTALDRGRYLRTFDSLNPLRTVRIAAVVSPTTVLTDPPLTQDAGPIRWEVVPVEGREDHVVLEVLTGDVAPLRPGWILSDGVADYTLIGRAHFPNRRTGAEVPVPLVEYEGQDASIDTLGRLVAPSLGLSMPDAYGRPVLLAHSAYAANRGRFWLGPQVSAGVFALRGPTGVPVALVPDAGPLYWGVLPRAQITVQALIPRGTVEQQGADLELASPGVKVPITCASGRFQAGRDEGKVVTLLYPTVVRSARVVEVQSTTGLLIEALDGQTLAATSARGWFLRSVTLSDSRVQLTARAPALLPELAGDFGLTVDRQEREERQRGWVYHVAQWTLLKGADAGYGAVGALAGATVAVQPLYRVVRSVVPSLPSEVQVLWREFGAGRAGADGQLSAGAGGAVRFSAPSARFRASDVGRVLVVSESGISGNNQIYTIGAVISLTTADFATVHRATLPDSSVVAWCVAREYATQPPLLPRFDEVNSDLMEELVDGLPPQTTDGWGVDKWCWEADAVESIAVTVTATVAVADRFRVTVTGRADVVVGVGAWKLVDASGESFFLETVPQSVDPGPPSFSFEVQTVRPPASGAASLVYVCSTALSRNYSAAAKALVTVTPDWTSASAAEMAEYQERFRRKLAEVVPVHVEVLLRFRQEAEAAFGLNDGGLSATIET